MLMESVLRRKFIVIFSHAKCIKCIWINYIILLKYYIYSPYNYELILKKKQHQSFWPPTPRPYPLGDIKQKMLYVCISMEPALILQKLQYRFFSLIHTCMARWKVDVIHTMHPKELFHTWNIIQGCLYSTVVSRDLRPANEVVLDSFLKLGEGVGPNFSHVNRKSGLFRIMSHCVRYFFCSLTGTLNTVLAAREDIYLSIIERIFICLGLKYI